VNEPVPSHDATTVNQSYSLIQKELQPNKIVNKGNSVFGNQHRMKEVPKLNAHAVKRKGGTL
jgi:hypothetical protein